MKTTTSYNRKSIMTKAWEIVRKFGKTMSEALKLAWANAKTVRSAIEATGISEEMHTWFGWKELGFEVLHESKNVMQVKVVDLKTKSGLRTLSFFTASQVAPIETVA